jgi:hypothetical protein
MRHLLCLVAASLSVSALASDAVGQAQQRARDCVVAGAIHPFGTNSEGFINVAAGESCNLSLFTSGTIEASTISERPQNGELRMVSMANALYTPKPGFTGTDEFAFTITGRNQNVSGTSVLRIRANVK